MKNTGSFAICDSMRKMGMIKKFLAIGMILGLIIIIEAVYLFKNQFNNSQSYNVILTKEGFSPQDLTVSKGDTVVFKTEWNQPFWPASNLHPTHSIYPEFDPKEPIEAEESWSFTFINVGEWKYHDHLSSLYRGVIKVEDKKTRNWFQNFLFFERSRASRGRIEKSGSSLRQLADRTVSLEAASRNSGCENVECWEDLIDGALKYKGLNEAFELLATLYQSEPEFASSCHDFAHELGKKAYLLFSERKDFQLSDKSFYCGYGFYHGFMETLLQTTGDMNEARGFCEYADSQLRITTADAGGACYHGIGHGAVDGSDPRAWGDIQAMIEPALKLCEMVSDDENPIVPPRYGKLFRCASGVFNGLEILASSGQYELSINRENPFWICRSQPDRYKEACFTQFVVAVLSTTSGDFIKSSEIIDSIKEDEYALPTLQSLVVELPHLGRIDYEETLKYCRNLSERFRETCVYAFAEGFMKYGPPQKEYLEALEFCNFDLLTEAEKQACFGRILSILRIWYTAEKSQGICQSVEEKYQRNNCQYR